MEMADRKRSATWRGWVLGVVAILALAALASGILIALGIISSPYPQIIGKDCGTITGGEGGRGGDFTSSEQCLWTAYQTCQAATLVYNNTGLDFTLTHAVSVQQHGARCSVTDATQGEGSVGRPTRHSYQCSGMEQQVRGLVILSCGAEGDITIPASPASAWRGHAGDAVLTLSWWLDRAPRGGRACAGNASCG